MYTHARVCTHTHTHTHTHMHDTNIVIVMTTNNVAKLQQFSLRESQVANLKEYIELLNSHGEIYKSF